MSKIEWTDKTWNPVTGCTPISEGCQNCYAARMAKRLAGRFGYTKDDPFKPGVVHHNQMDKPYHWKKPQKIFVCSMGDLFHPMNEIKDINSVFIRMCMADWHTYMVLTKRPHEFKKFLSIGTGWRGMLENVWFGVTAENQKRADERIPILLEITAAVRFVSVEPILETVDVVWRGGIDWVIVGPETGPGRRECKIDWIERIAEDCMIQDIPLFIKAIPLNGKISKNMDEWPEHLRLREFPKTQ